MSQKTNALESVRQLPAPARLGLFLCCLTLLWLPLALPVYWVFGQSSEPFLLLWLLALFLGLIGFWGKQVEQQPAPYRYYGLEISSRSAQELVLGIGLGVVSLVILLHLQVSLGWLRWQNLGSIATHLLPGLAVGIGVSFAEELLFRGWLLTELDRDYLPGTSLAVSSVVFMLLHFTNGEVIRHNWAQFPGLLILAANFVAARRLRQGRLSLAMGLHGGLIWSYYLVDVGDLIVSLDKVPAVLTGINGNPLAGVTGIAFLVLMAQLLPPCSRLIDRHLRISP